MPSGRRGPQVAESHTLEQRGVPPTLLPELISKCRLGKRIKVVMLFNTSDDTPEIFNTSE
jgi:hypothetical protein